MRYLLILTLLTLTACGFHLRGSVEIPPYLKTIQLEDASPATRIAPELERALQDEGVIVTGDVALANAVLRLHSESFTRRVQAVDASGKAQEYGLHYVVVFSVLGPDGIAWLSNANVSATRDLRFDEGAVLGAGGEQEQLQAEMRAEAVRGILRQLARVTPVTAEAEIAPAAGNVP
ncbi:MAG: LPS assembly lipoprotein LptE [Gammaproteobacteria bacterium]|nr:LPS assembly lipoprotein LptE [Gammaproteobacteria bacterium]MCF6363833.1 LPS assembly lipoprotein LptE [Gammaproteobacteria bacterium]